MQANQIKKKRILRSTVMTNLLDAETAALKMGTIKFPVFTQVVLGDPKYRCKSNFFTPAFW